MDSVLKGRVEVHFDLFILEAGTLGRRTCSKEKWTENVDFQ